MSWYSDRVAGFAYALRGIGVLLREPHAQIHALATVLVVALGLYLGVSRHDWQSLVLVIALVWLAEGLNTALEFLCDAAVPRRHPLVARAKDVAAASVLICALAALVMAGLTFLPYA